MSKRVTINELLRVAQNVIHMIGQYKGAQRNTEMRLDPLLYGYLQGAFGRFTRQHQRKIGKSERPKRIDFRQGGTRPVGIEFAVRTPGHNEIAGSQNRDEINKLARLPKGQWGTRILLLLDLAKKPITKDDLKATYENVKTGRGKYVRHTITVAYAHSKLRYRFPWKHKK
jgi:hypothetical protein